MTSKYYRSPIHLFPLNFIQRYWRNESLSAVTQVQGYHIQGKIACQETLYNHSIPALYTNTLTRAKAHRGRKEQMPYLDGRFEIRTFALASSHRREGYPSLSPPVSPPGRGLSSCEPEVHSHSWLFQRLHTPQAPWHHHQHARLARAILPALALAYEAISQDLAAQDAHYEPGEHTPVQLRIWS